VAVFRWPPSGPHLSAKAIGHVETLPWTLSIPVKVESMGGSRRE